MTSESRPLIVNVDDDDALRYVKTRDLETAGFTVVEARTGAEALQLVEKHRPPVVLLDVQLPDISGLEVCAFIKRKWPDVMVLQTSATFTNVVDRVLGLESGADSYLVQPAEPIELAAAINALLRIHRSENALRSLNATLEQRVADRVTELADANAKLTVEIAQRQKAEATLVQSQKMEAVGQLTGGLAHDFNNLLTAVVGNLDMIRARTNDPRLLRHAENAFKAADRGAKLTAQLLAFSRTQKLATAPIDINALVEGARELLEQSLRGARVELEANLAPELPPVLADANQLELAILNLAINGRDAMPQGGKITITTSMDRPDSDTVLVTMSDTGTGMTAEVLARAFDPFFTTKPAGKGTGLGLSQVYGVARQLGGDVDIKSEVGQGTRVTLKLRRAASVPHAESGEKNASTGGSSERILVIDDDDDVRELMGTILTDLGYVVEVLKEPDAAEAHLDSFNPHLLLVDFAMPGLNGADVARLATARKPDLPILFVSGFSDSSALQAAVGNASLLQKPFRPAELAAAVRATLDRAP